MVCVQTVASPEPVMLWKLLMTTKVEVFGLF